MRLSDKAHFLSFQKSRQSAPRARATRNRARTSTGRVRPRARHSMIRPPFSHHLRPFPQSSSRLESDSDAHTTTCISKRGPRAARSRDGPLRRCFGERRVALLMTNSSPLGLALRRRRGRGLNAPAARHRVPVKRPILSKLSLTTRETREKRARQSLGQCSLALGAVHCLLRMLPRRCSRSSPFQKSSRVPPIEGLRAKPL